MVDMSRCIVSKPKPCLVHGPVIDVMRLDDRVYCTQCLAAAAGYKRWFYTGSKHVDDIEELIKNEGLVNLP